MLYCERCDTEYEAEEQCMCATYIRRMEGGQKNRVPLAWKVDNWDGYFNDPWECEHVEFDEPIEGRARCLGCGENITERAVEWKKAGTLYPPWEQHPINPKFPRWLK